MHAFMQLVHFERIFHFYQYIKDSRIHQIISRSTSQSIIIRATYCNRGKHENMIKEDEEPA